MTLAIMKRADFITSIVLMALSIAVVEESWRMPRYTDVASDIWSAPGIVPGFLGVALFIMAAILFLRSRGEPAGPAEGVVTEPGWHKRIALVTGLCILYAGGLVGRIPFWLATFIFVFGFIVVFELLEPEQRPRWPRHVIGALIIAALTSGLVSYVFANLFFVRLP